MSHCLLTIDEARAELRCGRSKFYELVKQGKIRLRKLGRNSFVTRADLDQFLADLAA